MMKIFNKLNGWKTYITALIAVLTALMAFLNHTINFTEFVAAVFAAVQTANIRHSITTTATSTTGKSA